MGCSEPSPSPPDESKLSIYQLARRHCRERLLIDPLLWTDRHVALLQFVFEPPTEAPPHFPGGQEQPTTLPTKLTLPHGVARFVNSLVYRWTRREREFWNLMTQPGSPFIALSKDLVIQFNRRPIRKLGCVVLFLASSIDDDFHLIDDALNRHVPPVAAMIDRQHVAYMRNSYFFKGLCRQNSVNMALAQAKYNQIKPANPLNDPFTMALLISIAYEQREALRERGREQEAGAAVFLAQVIILDPDYKDSIHLFAADIASSLLDKLDFPHIPPPVSAQGATSIQHTIVPCHPFETFRRRVFKHLVPTLDIMKPNLRGEDVPPRQSGPSESGSGTC